MLGIVIVGGNGFLGSHLARSLRGRARVVVTYAQHRVPLDGVLSVQLDVRDVPGMQRILYAQRPDVVAYLGGPEDVPWAEANPKLAEKVFSTGTGDIVQAAEIISARFLYVSSTTVFSGTRGNYVESDPISPVTQLGKAKASGENTVRGRSSRGSILRLSPLAGSSHPWRPSLFDSIRYALEAGETLELRDDEYHSWCAVADAVAAIEAVIDRGPRSSLFHYGGLTRLTTLEMARLFARSIGYDEKTVMEKLVSKKSPPIKGSSPHAEREKSDLSLNSTLMIQSLGVKAHPIESVLRDTFTVGDQTPR